ncbi:MAG: ornithine cyclodeaminase family protein [Candidatus Krumholzibacteria bacterium]
MQTHILTERDVYTLLPMEECMDVVSKALEMASKGQTVNPLRTALRLPEKDGLLGMMPAYLGSPESVGIKVVTVMPGNHGTEFDAHQGAVLLFEPEHGCLLAVIDASSITAIRTAAASGVATRLLASPGASQLAILGSGVQAKSHLEAMRLARNITEVRVWSRTPANAQRFAERESARHGIDIHAAATAREAVTGAEIICTCTSSDKPVLAGEWIADGAHVNAVGACLPKSRELNTVAVVKSRLFVDRRESALNEAGDFLIPKKEGAIDDGHIVGEIGEVLLGNVPSRQAPDEITLFESLGIACEDLATAHYVYRKAVDSNTGVTIDFGGMWE